MKKLLLGAAALAALTTPTMAGTLTYDHYSWTGIDIHITSPNNISGGAGPITLYNNGQIVASGVWCMDVDNYLVGSAAVGTLPFTVANADSGLPGVPTNLSAQQLGVISWLVDLGDHASSATEQGIFQVAIWSEEYGNAFSYDDSSLGISGNVTTDLSTALGDYNANGNASEKLTFLVPGYGATSQTLVFGSPIPEPSTWAMMLAGFGLIGALGWRKNRVRYVV